jgi:hypothetical protein
MKKNNSESKFLQFFCISLLLLSFLVVGLSPDSAHALAKIKLIDGTEIFEVVDGDANDLLPTVWGIVSYTTDSFSVFSNVTVTGSLLGTTTQPRMTLSSGVIGEGSIDIFFSETGFGPSAGYFDTSAGGTPQGTVSFESYVDRANGQYITSDELVGGPIISVPGSDITGPYTLSNPYSLTTKTSITHSGNDITTVNMDVQLVPEPVSAALFLIGGTVMVTRVYMRRKRT